MKTIKDLAEELVDSVEDMSYAYQGYEKEISQFISDLLTLISECVGEMEDCPRKTANHSQIICRPCVRNYFRAQFNSKLSERSGLKGDRK